MTQVTERQLTNIFVPDRGFVGYVLHIRPSESFRAFISQIQNELDRKFPGAIWKMPAESLHVTVINWLAPLVDYGKSHDELYAERGVFYAKVMEEIIGEQRPITITFDTMSASPDAVIMQGRDDGSIQRIREEFLSKTAAVPGATTPTTSFIHTTICRYTDRIDVAAVQEALASFDVALEEHVSEFLLSRESWLFAEGAQPVQRFTLKPE